MGELATPFDKKRWNESVATLGEWGALLSIGVVGDRLDYQHLLRVSSHVGYLIRNASTEASAEFPILHRGVVEAVKIDVKEGEVAIRGSFGRGLGAPLGNGRIVVAVQSEPYDLYDRTAFNYQLGVFEAEGLPVGTLTTQAQWTASGEFAANDGFVPHDMLRPLGDVPGDQFAILGGLLADLSFGIRRNVPGLS